MPDSNDLDTSISVAELATELTVAWLGSSHNRVNADDVPASAKIYDTLAAISSGIVAEEVAPQDEYAPAVSVRKSLASREHIISMINGKPYRTLRRHLTTHDLPPDDYRKRYGLKVDYPMVAPAYSESGSEMVKTNGLGRKVGEKASVKAPKPPKASNAKAAAKAHLGGDDEE